MAHIIDFIANEYEKLQHRFKIREAAKGLNRAKEMHEDQKAAIRGMLSRSPKGFDELLAYYERIGRACEDIFAMKNVPDNLLKDTQKEYYLAKGVLMFLKNLAKP